LDVRGGREGNDGVNMRRKRNKHRWSDMMAKESDFLLSENIFVRIYVEAILSKDRENVVKVKKVLRMLLAENECKGKDQKRESHYKFFFFPTSFLFCALHLFSKSKLKA
jgi:hypothetical protein